MVKHMSYRRRVQALTLLGEGLRHSEVVRQLGVHRSYLWKLEQFGVKGPTKVRMTRKKRILMFAIKEQVQAIKMAVKEMPCLTSF